MAGAGEFNRTIDAGLYREGSIHPFAYLDENGDGTQDSNEGAFPDDPGKTFVLTDAAGDEVFRGTTVDGQVHIEGLTPGTYTLTEELPDGFYYSGSGTQSIVRTFTVTSGEELVFPVCSTSSSQRSAPANGVEPIRAWPSHCGWWRSRSS